MAFYMTLPSNSSLNFFPHNDAGHFFSKLPQTVDLKGEWEVALAEIQLVNNFYNVPSEEIWFEYATSNDEIMRRVFEEEVAEEERINDIKSIKRKKKMVMDPGLFVSNKKFVDKLNEMAKTIKLVSNQVSPICFKYMDTSKRVKIVMNEEGSKLTMSPTLRRILSVPRDVDHLGGSVKWITPKVIDIHQSFKGIFVYCDLVSPRPVGDVMAPLLRTLPISYKDVFHQIYIKPHYGRLSRTQFDTVEILLSTDTGEKLSFFSGHTVVTLHFRPRP